MTSPRGRFDIAQIGSKLYACGGSNGSKDLKSAEMYDFETDTWTRLPDMKWERSSPGEFWLRGGKINQINPLA